MGGIGARLGRVRKSHVGLGLGLAITLAYVVSAYGLAPLHPAAPSSFVAVPLLAVATLLLAVVWMVEEEAKAITGQTPEAEHVALECRVLGFASLVYFSMFFGLWAVLDTIDPTLGWHHLLLIVLFLVWEVALGAYGYGLKRRLARLGGAPFWWWRARGRPAAGQAPDDP